MKRRLTSKLLLASLAIAPLAAAPTSVATAQSVVRPTSEVVLSIGRGELVNVPGTMADVFVANEEIADVQIKSQRQLFVMGKSGGETTIYASNAAGDIIWSANIRVGSNIGSIDQLLAMAMPQAKISVATMGSNVILLTGTVAAPEDAAEAQRLVEAYVGTDANVISRLRMATPLQVNLQVRIAEVSRSVVRALGVNLTSVDATGGFKFGIGQGRSPFTQVSPGGPVAVGSDLEGDLYNIVNQGSSGSTLGAFGKFLGLDIGAALDLAETQGLVTTLSQPNLTALSGETAEFLAGGEFPIPLAQGLGTTTIEYKNYGVSLAYTPTVLANGRISMRVRPEVSELSSQGAITLNGFEVPALTTRRAETTIELGSGQSFMIAGLLSNSATNTIDKAPGLGDIPILGNLFRSTTYRKGETELVIVVTPYLVKPVDGNDIKLPTDGFRKPSEFQRLLGFQQSDGVTGAERPKPRAVENAPAAPSVSQGLPADDGEQQPKRESEARRASAQPGFSFE
ncbi:type II and III secretion system protein family protein [Qipengyuania citrea]|uniref:type II and III secretion system protein family protein n=1 Tax=Qipengyuania citrea TaxID=225971 RepID=UPI000ED0334E|nr:type II and III secretion system protein family protein [Qipengyuania citrea]MCD1590028.1 type II and III secretion system protein family protein [Qipengyuania citrea]HCC26342.1 secretion system protein [Erythrobacter sp.]HCY03498.1 secretion system protein [Erythrobacter sp.]|tara:strand:+ start:2557 stop:4089 length:1533 start_codon:yes stop_codon:yes gene_type:complete